MIIDGEKYACEACIRGHRVTGCTHHDRALQKIAKKGRPVSQCAHCRANRKNRNEHGKCECSNKKKKKTDPKACRCDAGGPCLCSKKKTPKQEKTGQDKAQLTTPVTTLPPSTDGQTVDVLLQTSASIGQLGHINAATSASLQVSLAPDAFLETSQYGIQGPKRQKLTSARSESSLAFMGKPHKLHARNHGLHTTSPYTIPHMLPGSLHVKSEQASPESQTTTLPIESDFLSPVTALTIPNDSPTPVTTAGSFLTPNGQTDPLSMPLTSASSTSLVGMPALTGMAVPRLPQNRYQPNLSINTAHSLTQFPFDNSVLYSAGIEQPQFSPGITTPGWDALPPVTPSIPATPNPLVPFNGQLSPVDFTPQRSFSLVGFPSTIPENSTLNDFGQTNGVTAEPISSNSSDLADEPYGRSNASSMLDLNGLNTAQSYDSLGNMWVKKGDDLANSSSTLYQRFGALSTGMKFGEYAFDDGMGGDGLEDDGLWMASSINVNVNLQQAPMQMQDGTIQPAVVFQPTPATQNPDGTANF